MHMGSRRVQKRSILTSVIARMTLFSHLIIFGDHGRGSFRARIKLNATFTSGRKMKRILSLAHVRCKKDNGEIMGNISMTPIWDRQKNICAGGFLGRSYEGKTQFKILPHGCPLPPTRAKTICNPVSPHIFITGDLVFYAIVLGKEGRSPY